MKIYVLAGGEIGGRWICDVLKREWDQNHSLLKKLQDKLQDKSQDDYLVSTQNPNEADIIWLLAGWAWKRIPLQLLKSKKVITTIHHIVPDKFNQSRQQNFKARDQITDLYHTACQKTTEFIKKLTTKPIKSLPFWINSQIWKKLYQTDLEQNQLRSKWKIPLKEQTSDNYYIVGSFQRDTEGGPLAKGQIVPKLEKGPDILCRILWDLKQKQGKKLFVVLSGCRREYVIRQLHRMRIQYVYYEMVSLEDLNELYNTLDLYIVSSRCEGGPRAIMEGGLSETPIIASDVGIVPEFLPKESIFDWEKWISYRNAIPKPKIVLENVKQCTIPNYFEQFNNTIINNIPNNIPNNMCSGLISINEMNNDTSWESSSTTSDEKAIILYLKNILSQNYSFQEPNQELKLKLNFLHIGVGNSEMAQILSRYLTHIDGITIAGKEVIHSEKVSKANNITNYNVHIVNKYDIPSMKIKLKNNRKNNKKYDIISDNNLKSYACCQKHFLEYFDLLVSLLNNNGFIITASKGMKWSSIPAGKVDINNPTRRGHITSPNQNNILTIDEMTQLAEKYNLSIKEYRNRFDTIYILSKSGYK